MTKEEIEEKFKERSKLINYPSLDKEITVNTKDLFVILNILLEESAASNFKWWSDNMMMYIEGEMEMIPSEAYPFVKSALDTLAECGTMELEKALQIIEEKGI